MSGPGWQQQQPDNQQYPQQPPAQPAQYPPGFTPPAQNAPTPPGPQQPPPAAFQAQQDSAAHPPGFQPQGAAGSRPGFQPQQQAAAYPPGFQPQAPGRPPQTPASGFHPQQAPPPGFQPQPGADHHQQQGASFIPGFDQTRPYQQQWSPEQPKRKSKLPKILIITAIVLLVLAGGGWVTWRIIYVSRDEGATPIGAQPNPRCAVSEEALKSANATVFTRGYEDQGNFYCDYSIARGGSTVRTIRVAVVPNVHPQLVADPNVFQRQFGDTQGSFKAGPKLGDKSTYRAFEHDGHTYLDLYVLKGDTITKVSLYGYTKGFFGDTPAPLDQGEKDLTAIAKELVEKK
ncbi:hypothetical protein [Actinocrispum sp. NPDC049592]|uniref:hypothetical protein n=1 Tax=Actinocrispum sp. NPDC049592 TaxID=3154835 RepID=UPI0034391A1A